MSFKLKRITMKKMLFNIVFIFVSSVLVYLLVIMAIL